MLNWFNTREVDEFAKTIAADLIKRVPATAVDPSDTKVQKKLLSTQNWIFDRLERFAQGRSLNLYQKASFGNTLKWALKDAAFAPEVVDAWTQELVAHLTLIPAAKE